MSPGKDPARLRVAGDLFFWIGVGFVVAALTVVALSNTAAVAPFERHTVPLSWILAGAAISALLAAEHYHTASSRPPSPNQPQPAEHAGAIGLVHSHR